MTLKEAKAGIEYIVKSMQTDDEGLDAFLFSLGLYDGAPVTLVSRVSGGCVLSIKDGRYCIDNKLAEVIFIERT